jgi:SAF domain
MATSFPSVRPGRSGAGAKPLSPAPGASRLAVAPRRRTRPFLAVGAVLALAGAVAFTLAYTHLGGRASVIELKSAVTAGQVITAGDLRSVQVAADSSVPLFPVADAARVIGHRAAVSLPAGTLLSPADLGAGAIPAAGQALVALEVKPGAFPAQVAAGATVAVATVAPAGQGGAPVIVADLPTATVLSVTAAANSSGDVEVSLQATASSAGQIAAIPPDAAELIVLSSGGR